MLRPFPPHECVCVFKHVIYKFFVLFKTLLVNVFPPSISFSSTVHWTQLSVEVGFLLALARWILPQNILQLEGREYIFFSLFPQLMEPIISFLHVFRLSSRMRLFTPLINTSSQPIRLCRSLTISADAPSFPPRDEEQRGAEPLSFRAHQF